MRRFVFILSMFFTITYLTGCGENKFETTPSSTDNEASSASVFDRQSREGGAVTISVTPQNLGENYPVWTFKVEMNTHSVDLSQDPATVSVVSANGKEYKAVSWEGDPPGGHHRSGTLNFAAISPRPQKIDLIIRDIGGVERNYSWTP